LTPLTRTHFMGTFKNLVSQQIRSVSFSSEDEEGSDTHLVLLVDGCNNNYLFHIPLMRGVELIWSYWWTDDTDIQQTTLIKVITLFKYLFICGVFEM